MKDNLVFIRVGEKNNFSFTDEEITELKKYHTKGHLFVNSNSFTTVKNNYPSIITINPYLIFNPLDKKSDTSNIKAFRVKVFLTHDKYYQDEQKKCFDYAKKLNIPVLITFFRARDKKTLEQFKMIKECYTNMKNNGSRDMFYRIKKEHKKQVLKDISIFMADKKHLVNVCDLKSKGCPSCLLCTKLTYQKKGKIKALNLSISGINDIYGNAGLCPFKCPSCYAKVITRGRRPSCDKLIDNKKIIGKLNN